MRKKIFDMIEMSEHNDLISKLYNGLMFIAIVISLIPLMFRHTNQTFILMDKITVTIFIIDYILRISTADFKYNNKSINSFLKYPFSFMAIIDLLSIIPSITPITNGFHSLKVLRALRLMKILRIFKIFRYSKNIKIVFTVVKKSKSALLTVCSLAIGYVFTSALIIFNLEPQSFKTFFDAIYWATVSLTTMGYGDIYPVTTIGRLITMISAFLGIAIVALPAGIITSGYMEEILGDKKCD